MTSSFKVFFFIGISFHTRKAVNLYCQKPDKTDSSPPPKKTDSSPSTKVEFHSSHYFVQFFPHIQDYYIHMTIPFTFFFRIHYPYFSIPLKLWDISENRSEGVFLACGNRLLFSALRTQENVDKPFLLEEEVAAVLYTPPMSLFLVLAQGSPCSNSLCSPKRSLVLK